MDTKLCKKYYELKEKHGSDFQKFWLEYRIKEYGLYYHPAFIKARSYKEKNTHVVFALIDNSTVIKIGESRKLYNYLLEFYERWDNKYYQKTKTFPTLYILADELETIQETNLIKKKHTKQSIIRKYKLDNIIHSEHLSIPIISTEDFFKEIN